MMLIGIAALAFALGVLLGIEMAWRLFSRGLNLEEPTFWGGYFRSRQKDSPRKETRKKVLAALEEGFTRAGRARWQNTT